MKKEKIVVLHGNPGHPSDLERLCAQINLPANIEWCFVQYNASQDRELMEVLDQSLPNDDYFSALAYSFGCFALLKWAQLRGKKLKRMVMLNPTLTAENPLPLLKQWIISLPVIGSKILEGAATQLATDFVEKTFAPLRADPSETARMFSYLNRADTWKQASDKKVFQQKHPLTGNLSEIIEYLAILRGEKDEAVNWEIQQKVVQQTGLQAQEHHVISGVGHSLPWSFNQPVIDIIQRIFSAQFDGRVYNEQQKVAFASSSTSTSAANSTPVSVATAKGLRIGYQAACVAENNVISYLESHLSHFPDRCALRWVEPEDLEKWDGHFQSPLPHREISYIQFGKMISAVASGLSKLGITKGDRVIIFLPMNTLMYTAMFAVQRIGAIAVFLDSWARSSHLGASAKCAQPKAMISHKAAFDLIKDVAEFQDMPLRIIAGPGNDGSFAAQLEQLVEGNEGTDIVPVESEMTALITFTTGSSGTPKGANRTHRFLCAQHEALSKVIPYNPTDVDMPAFPIFSLNNLATGVTTLLPAINLAAPSDRDAAAMVSQILHEKITCTTLSPSMLNGVSAFCLQKQVELSSLRRVVTGGAPISRDNVADFKKIAPNAEIWVLYGSTEVEPMAHIEAVEMLSIKPDPDPEIVENGVNVGHISEDLQYKFIKIVRDAIDLNKTPWSELEVAAGEVGEFVVTGDHVCRDYYNNQEAFYKSKILDSEGRVWHRTGDLARLDSNGYLWVVGRIHNVIERGGSYFFPVSAEVILKRLPHVKQGAFLGLPDPSLGNKTAVAIEMKAGKKADEALKSEIIRLFQKNKIPVDCLFVVEKIPMDPRHHSKVEYDILRNILLSSQSKDLLAG